MKRERIEDLGRIAERLHSVLENHIFDIYGFSEKWDCPEKMEELALTIDHVKMEISHIYEIARWGDDD